MPMTYSPPGGLASTSFTPALQGATENPSAVTYSTQVGRYSLVGKVCHFWIKIVTTSITKTTLTDALRISLPFTAVNNANQVGRVNAMVSNATPVQNANAGYIAPNTAYVTLAQVPLTAAQANITYEATSLGVLTNTITMELSGSYETT